jgi:outer membrane receptor protein involved in Fe transport
MNVFGKYFIQLTQNSKLTFSLGGYNSGWNASGQIPTRAVKNGFIERFEALDPLEGGITDRENLSVQYTFKSHTGSELQLQSYLSNYNFKLFSNFTYFLNDSINGDMIEQCERRTIHGMNAVYKFTSKLNSINVVNRLGSSYRSDNITPQLWHSPDRNRLSVYTNDQIMQQNFSVWGEQDLFLSPALRLTWGIRHDLFTFSKNDLAEDIFDPNSNGLPHASGYAWNSVFSPKINLTVNPMRNLDIYLNFGQGFHSNDARDVVTGEKVNELSAKWKREGLSATQINDNLLKYHFNPLQRNTGSLPKATGGEIGVRTIMTDKLHVGIAGWYLYLEKEFIYAGDGGTTELSNSTTRIGFDAESRCTLTPWLWLDGDLSLSKGTVSDLPSGKNYIPLAPRLTASAGVNIMREKGWNGSLRLRHIGDRPADEENSLTAAGYTLLSANLAYKLRNYVFSVYCENIFDISWNEAQFATETRLRDETGTDTDICYTPGNRRNFQIGLTYKF